MITFCYDGLSNGSFFILYVWIMTYFSFILAFLMSPGICQSGLISASTNVFAILNPGLHVLYGSMHFVGFNFNCSFFNHFKIEICIT